MSTTTNNPILQRPHASRKCGAKTRIGQPCKSSTMSNGRCRMHGGLTPNKAGALFSKYLSPEDLQNISMASNSLGIVDQELNLVRVQLARVLRLRAEHEERKDHFQVAREKTTIDEKGNLKSTEIKRRARDYDGLIIRYTGRIASLEKTRKELAAENPNDNTLIIIGGLLVNAAELEDSKSGITISIPGGM